MTKETKIILAVMGIVLVAIGILISFVNSSRMDPAAIMERIVHEDSHRVGEGPVQVVEFGDYQCPACAQTNPDVERLKKEYEGKVTFVYSHFPLPGHPNARPAAEAAEAAGEQGKFWEMHSKLFDTQTQWASVADPTSLFAQYAEELKLDREKFTEDLKADKYKDRINRDQSDGYAVGVSGTPTFFINGKQQSSFDYDALKSAIEAELK
jgi:protein-disulfide isomerase